MMLKIKRKDPLSSKGDQICRKVIEYGLLGLIVFSPLPAASVHEWSILVIQLSVLLMMAAFFLLRTRPQNTDLYTRSLKWPKLFFSGLFLFIFIQIVPFPKFLIRLLSPNAYSFQRDFSTDFSRIKFMSFSLIPAHTLSQGLELLSYFLLGFLIIKTVTRRHQILRIFSVLIAMGIFEAFYGLFELYNKNPRILFYEKIHSLDSVTGTFVNRNHLSGYLEMIIPLAIGLIIARIDLFSSAGMEWREKLLRFAEKGLSINLFIFFGIVVMSLAIVFSKSRSGIFLLALTFILFFGFTILYLETTFQQKKWIKNFLTTAFVAVLSISFYIGVNATIKRFALDELLHESRPTFWAKTINSFLDYPILGTGLGTFASLYPSLEEDGNPVNIYHAHNDYLEYLSELGVVGMILLCGGILVMAVSSYLSWRIRSHPEVKGLALGGIVSLICMLIHSLTDFNLHIPANMLLFSVVLSLTFVTAFYKRSEANLVNKKK